MSFAWAEEPWESIDLRMDLGTKHPWRMVVPYMLRGREAIPLDHHSSMMMPCAGDGAAGRVPPHLAHGL